MPEEESFYSRIEEKYYSVVEKLGPVSVLVKAIDRFFPSFILLIITIFAVLAFFVLPVLFQSSIVELKLKLVNTNGDALQGSVLLSARGKQETLQTDLVGIIKKLFQHDSNVSFVALSKGYVDLKDKLQIEKENVFKELVLALKERTFDRKIIFALPSGERAKGKTIQAKLACSNSGVKQSQEIISSNKEAEADFVEPANCGTSLLTIINPAEFKQSTTMIVDPITVVALEYETIPKAALEITLVDEFGSKLASLNATVSLVRNGVIAQTVLADHGFASAELLPGHYEVLVQESTGKFAMVEKKETDLNANKKTKIEIEMTDKIKATATGKVLDSTTKKPVANATIELRDLKDFLIASIQTDETGSFSLPVVSETFLFLNAMAEGYLPNQQLVSSWQADLVIELEKITAENSGRIQVNVFDADGNPTENATVALHDANTGNIAPYEAKATDANGLAEFFGVKPGNYYALAEKYPYVQKSFEQETKFTETATFYVWFSEIEASVFLKAIGEKGNYLQETTVDVFDINGEKFDSIVLAEGKDYYNVKGEKRVFFKFSKEGFVPYYSESVNPFTSSNDIVARLRKQIKYSVPTAEFAGIFNDFGDSTFDLESGKEYSAKFELLVPSEQLQDSAGIHYRVGSGFDNSQDELEIVSLNAGKGDSLCGKAFNAPASEQTDLSLENTNSVPAKWCNANIQKPETAIYAVYFKIQVKESTPLNAMLPMFYRAFGEKNNVVYRAPLDSVLGNAVETKEKQGLYAETVFLQQFFKRAERACYGKVCISINVQEPKTKEFFESPFGVYKFSDYNVFFSVINASNSELENVSLYIASQKKDIKITSLVASEDQAFTDYNAYVGIGNVPAERSFDGTFSIFPEREDYTTMLFTVRIKDYNDFVFREYFDVLDKREMLISTMPEKPVALVENKLRLFALDKESSVGVPDTIFNIILLGFDGSESYKQTKSDKNGNAEIVLQAMKPGSSIVIEAISSSHYAKPVILEFGQNALYFSPKRTVVELDAEKNLEKKAVFHVVNAISETINIESIDLFLEDPAYFDATAMKNYLSKQKQKQSFSGFSEQDIELLLVKLNKNVFFPKNTRSKGALLVKAKSKTGSWGFSLPFEIIVNSVDYNGASACLEITDNEWIAELQKNLFYKTIELKNNCATNGEAINVYDLTAGIEWNSDVAGNLEITALDNAGNIISSAPIMQENSPVFLKELKAERKTKLLLAFTPKTSQWGKKAEFNISISAASPNKTSITKLETTSTTGGRILLFNPAQCVRFSLRPGESLKLGENDRNKSFELDTELCGDKKIEFSLCENDQECRGNAEEGGIMLSPDFFVIGQSTIKKQKIRVIREEISGIYGITFTARVEETVFKNFAEVLVEVTPTKDNQLLLDKYSFYLSGKNAMDSATITNKNLSETVRAEASVCDWQKMYENEKSQFNFGDAGGGIIPAGLDASKELLRQTTATSYAMAQVDNSAIVDAVEATRVAYDKAKVASAKMESALSKTQDLLQLISTIQTIVSALIGVIQLIQSIATMTDTSCSALTVGRRVGIMAINVAGSGAQVAVGMIKTKTQEVLEKMQEGYSNLSSSQSQAEAMKEAAEEGWQELFTDNSSDVSYANKTAAGSFNSAREAGKEAVQNNQKGQAAMQEAVDLLSGAVITEIGKMDASAAAMAAPIPGIFAILDAAVAACQEPACVRAACAAAVANEKATIITGLTVNIGQLTAATAALLAAVTNAAAMTNNALPSAEDAKQAELVAVAKLRRAISVAQSISEASFKLSESQGKNSEKLNKIVSLYPFIGYISGSFDGGIYSELENPCDYKVEGYVIDYITDLSRDLDEPKISIGDISAYIEKSEKKSFVDYNTQIIGLVLQNNGFAAEKPTYGILTTRYKVHEHDFVQKVRKNYPNFGPFSVQDNRIETIEQKFHVRIVTKPQQEGLAPRDAMLCLDGTKVGHAGSNALPKIKLSWSWDNTNGISETACSEKNPNSVYCDAAQFNIMLAKKINYLDEFFIKNPGKLKCPENKVETFIENNVKKLSERKVGEDSIGIEKITASVKGTSAIIDVFLENNANYEKTANVELRLVAPSGVTLEDTKKSCTKQFTMPANSKSQTICNFNNLEPSDKYYAAKSYLVPTDTVNIGEATVEFIDEQDIDLNSSLTVAFRTNQDLNKKDCWLPKTTDRYDGNTAIEYYVKDSNVSWTPNIKNKEALTDVLRFNSFLIEDNYSSSFLKDFTEYYSKIRFFDTPLFFSDNSNPRTLDKYYNGNKLVFTNKYFNTTQIAGAGLFNADLNIKFGKEWGLFNTGKQTDANISVVFNKIAEPELQSPFYYFPIDSEIGRTQYKILNRTDYGTSFAITGQPIKISSKNFESLLDSTLDKTFKTVKTKYSNSIEEINSHASTRGTIFSIELKQDENNYANLVLAPSYASPIIMKYKAEPAYDVSTTYKLLKNLEETNAGNSLAFWTGMGKCYGLTNSTAIEEFDYSQDRPAKITDRTTDWKNAFTLDFGNITKKGDLWLKTIIFTPTEGTFTIKTINQKTKFSTLKKEFSENVSLNGISGIPFDNKIADNGIETIQDALNLVETGKACLSNNGLETSIWWNSRELERAAENNNSIQTIESELQAGQNCLGK